MSILNKCQRQKRIVKPTMFYIYRNLLKNYSQIPNASLSTKPGQILITLTLCNCQ